MVCDPFDDAAKSRFADVIARQLEIQLELTGGVPINDGAGYPKRKAIGYVYGYVDAALRSIGKDMYDTSIGVPVTFQVIRKLWPGRETEYMGFLVQEYL